MRAVRSAVGVPSGIVMRCARCGSANISLAWPAGCPDAEHIHYTCRTCHYDWTGPTKDHEKGSRNDH